MRYESAGIVVVPRTNCDRDNVSQLPDETGNFAGLFPRGLNLEHVEQITGNTDEVVVRRLLDQPPKPVNAKVKIGGKKKFHWSTEKSRSGGKEPRRGLNDNPNLCTRVR